MTERPITLLRQPWRSNNYKESSFSVQSNAMQCTDRRVNGEPFRTDCAINGRILLITTVALLSQGGRAMLRAIECFAKSLKVIRNDTVE